MTNEDDHGMLYMPCKLKSTYNFTYTTLVFLNKQCRKTIQSSRATGFQVINHLPKVT